MSDNDPFAALEQAAHRQAAEEKAQKHLATARCRLVLGKDAKAVFFAKLAMDLSGPNESAKWDVPTMATDGKHLVYNPDFVNGLTIDEAIGVLAHEVMHNALKHPMRMGRRDHKRWNMAADGSVNPILEEAGYTLPKGRLMPGEGPLAKATKGMSAEEIYALLEEPESPPKPGDDQSDDPGGCGGVQAPGDGSPAACKQAEAEQEVAVAQAHNVAKQRGKLPGGIERLVQEVLAPKVDWREVLREFVSRFSKNDYSWSPPNRRFVHMGLYLPGLRSEELGDVVAAIDTSGSIGQKELSRFGSELQGVLEAYDCSLTILYHDSDIQHVQQWKSTDGPLVLEAKGGGGTSHIPVFDWIAEQGDPPACLVALTDMCSEFPSAGPDYPVLWASTTKGEEAPFGQLVEI
jgi:predicted metal-dependent peptidase